MHKKIIVLACVAASICVVAKPITELTFGSTKIDIENVDCKPGYDVIDECGLQQGYSYRQKGLEYPTNHSSLLEGCKRNADGFKCLKAYSRCLPPLSKQILLAMVNSRQRFNKKICTEKPSEAASKFLELTNCMKQSKVGVEKGTQAEINAIITPEAILNSNFDSLTDRVKHSCCSVAKARKEFMDATIPHCKQHTHVASEIMDSYLSETVALICPETRHDCEKLPKLTTQKTATARSFIRPVLNVVQTLA